jgi:hypothetical protein
MEMKLAQLSATATRFLGIAETSKAKATGYAHLP